MDAAKFKELVVRHKHCDFIVTLLVVKFLEANKESKYVLILKKAR